MNLSSFPGWVASLIFTGLAVIITNLCSNTATANVFVPILADLAITMCLHPVSVHSVCHHKQHKMIIMIIM